MKSIKVLIAAAAALVAINAAHAVKLSGGVTFAGGVTLNSGGVGSSTAVTSFDAEVESVSGDLTSFVSVGDAVAFVAPWTYNSGPIDDFWSVGGFTFDLISSSIEFQNGSAVVVSGKGWVSGNGYDATPGIWNFSTQNPSANNVFSFSASTEVPDAGATAMLLGTGLLALAFVRRKTR